MRFSLANINREQWDIFIPKFTVPESEQVPTVRVG